MKNFWEDEERLKRLAGIVESPEEDTEDEELDGRFNREQQVVNHVRQVFAELGIKVDSERYSVMYDEHPDNEVTVILDNNEKFTVKQLAMLHKSGMGDDYFIEPYDNITLQVKFKWKAI